MFWLTPSKQFCKPFCHKQVVYINYPVKQLSKGVLKIGLNTPSIKGNYLYDFKHAYTTASPFRIVKHDLQANMVKNSKVYLKYVRHFNKHGGRICLDYL